MKDSIPVKLRLTFNNFILQGFVASKVLPERACYISIMDRKMMPNFDALPKLAEQNVRAKGRSHLGNCAALQSKLMSGP